MNHRPASDRIILDSRLTPLSAAAVPLDFAICFGVGLAAQGVIALKSRLVCLEQCIFESVFDTRPCNRIFNSSSIKQFINIGFN